MHSHAYDSFIVQIDILFIPLPLLLVVAGRGCYPFPLYYDFFVFGEEAPNHFVV